MNQEVHILITLLHCYQEENCVNGCTISDMHPAKQARALCGTLDGHTLPKLVSRT